MKILICKNYDTRQMYKAVYRTADDGSSHADLEDGTSVPLDRLDQNGNKWQWTPDEEEK